jgi:Ca2+-binding RTX toxin-like protein
VLNFSSLTVREDDAASFVVSGTVGGFETVHLQLSVSDGTPVEYTVTADRDGLFNVPVDLSSFGHATVDISAWVTDAAGNSSQTSAATLTITDALPAATVISGTADDEVFSEIAGDAVQFQPGALGGTDHFIGSTAAFDSVLLTGSMADYAVTLVTGEARETQATLLSGQGVELLADQALYRVTNWTDGANTELWVQADSLIFDDGTIRLINGGMVASSDTGHTVLHGDIGYTNRLTGGAGDDTLFGHDGQDWLNGGAGDDTLVTIAGRDTLIGGEGDDELIVFGDDLSVGEDHDVTLFGGVGSDVFMVAPQAGFDRAVAVADFLIGEDKLDLSWLRVNDGGSARELTVEDLHLDQLNAELQDGGSVEIDLSQFVTTDNAPIQGTLVVQLVGGVSTFTEQDFILAASSSTLPDDTLLAQAHLMGPV